MKKILITQKQAEQFNAMQEALYRISKLYMTPSQLYKNCEKDFGIYDYEEALGMSYENIQAEAAKALKRVKKININPVSNA